MHVLPCTDSRIGRCLCRKSVKLTKAALEVSGHCRYKMNSLAAMVLDYASASSFELVVGIGDSTSFYSEDPSWLQPAARKDACYVGARRPCPAFRAGRRESRSRAQLHACRPRCRSGAGHVAAVLIRSVMR